MFEQLKKDKDKAFVIAEIGSNHCGSVDRAIECLESNKDATSSMVVSEALQPPMKALKEKDGYLVSYYESRSQEIVNRQELPKAYYRSNIITSRVDDFLKTKNQVGDKSLKVEIPIERSLDINSELDFYLAEKVMKKNRVER
jgi:CMP-N-acetylneuraminic acid synthetase